MAGVPGGFGLGGLVRLRPLLHVMGARGQARAMELHRREAVHGVSAGGLAGAQRPCGLMLFQRLLLLIGEWAGARGAH